MYKRQDLVARYVVPAINGLLDDYKESNQYVIENRDTWNRAGQAIMSKIQENERAVAAMKEQAGPSQSALAPHSGEATKKAAKGKPS